MDEVVFIGSRRHELHGNGKLSQAFWRFCVPVLARHGVAVTTVRDLDHLRRATPRWERALFCLIYNEDEEEAVFSEMAEVEHEIRARCRFPTIVHSAEVCRIVGSKAAANRLFAENGIPVAPQVDAGRAARAVFSNARRGSGAQAFVAQAGEVVDDARFNTAFVDTAFTFRGRSYLVSLRAMCVGMACIAIYVRCRPRDEGDPTVHSRDTPLDPDLINAVYAEVALPRQEAILALCRRIGEVLGLGFYSHDLLPCAETGRVYVCEPGFKFEEFTLRDHLAPLRGQVYCAELFDGVETVRMTHAFLAEARRLGAFDG